MDRTNAASRPDRAGSDRGGPTPERVCVSSLPASMIAGVESLPPVPERQVRPARARVPGRILIVDDDESVAQVIARMAGHFGHRTTVAGGVDEAIRRLAEAPFDVVFTDLVMGERGGLELVEHVRTESPEVPVVVITGQATIDTAMQAIRLGAYDYLTKPVEMNRLGALLDRAIDRKLMAEEMRHLQREIQSHYSPGDPVGQSPQMLEVFKTVVRVASGRSNVLILGESGTGKELVARALHNESPRKAHRFVPVNVSAIPEGLLESELFGHVRGAFTGATTNRRGLFDEAHLGTLFLDEIGDLSTPLQAKLLRVIQEHVIKPVGGNEEHEVDVRLVGATHRNLEEMMRAGQFREDLYYRLNVVSIPLPPLRERREDIPLLVGHFLRKYEHETGRAPAGVSPEAFKLLETYPWPGNVRELENVVERAVLLSTEGVITPDSLPPRLHGHSAEPDYLPLDAMVARYIERVLEHTNGNRTRAAQILGISRRTLHRMDERRRRESASVQDNSSHTTPN
jgi:DNA-binding NtrC family response regulator